MEAEPTRLEHPDGVERARASAQAVFDDPGAPVLYEPADAREAAAAVDELAARFGEAAGTFRQILENARSGAETLSDDPLQGLAEVVQNADDTGATAVRFDLTADELRVQHNGRPVDLGDLHAMSAPWLSTKKKKAEATGRFGIGLGTLHALAETFEVHSGSYHVRLGPPRLTNIEPLPPVETEGSWTVLRVPLERQTVSPDDFAAWCARWDDTSLLFLATVREVSFNWPGGSRDLSLVWGDGGAYEATIASESVVILERSCAAPDGRTWRVHSATVTSPDGLTRAHKQTAPCTPIAVAIAHDQPDGSGALYAGLPVVGLELPIRANAQFDPVTSRRALAPTRWNLALIDRIAELWKLAVVRTFLDGPAAAWGNLPAGTLLEHRPHAVGHLVEAVRGASLECALEAAVIVEREPIRIVDLAVEAESLTGVLSDRESARLAGRSATLPVTARDSRGRWRAVLGAWRSAGVDVADEVSIHDAVALTADPTRSVDRTIILTAVILRAGLGALLSEMNCIEDRDGHRHRPRPMGGDLLPILTDGALGLAATLGISAVIHPAYLTEDQAAEEVCDWLRHAGTLTPGDNDLATLEKLAAAGLAGAVMAEPLTDPQVVSLRATLEAAGAAKWENLGRGIGQAIRLDASTYDVRGRRTSTHARPSDSYQPKAIDREPDSFAVAADTTSGLLWIAGRYSSILRSPAGRAGLGAQRFLRCLGCETSPRMRPHPALEGKYSTSRARGLAARAYGSPAQRVRALQDLDSDFTLDDLDCPDLSAVIDHIARDSRSPKARRARAKAVLGLLARNWRELGDVADVTAAWANYGWNTRGAVAAWWVWQLRSVAWLDDARGQPSAPRDLRLKTPATMAVYGVGAPGYLHPDFASTRAEVLAALAIEGEPSTRALLGRLQDLRTEAAEHNYLVAETGIVYRALSERISARGRSLQMTPTELRNGFVKSQLIYTSDGRWVAPPECFTGPPVFGARRRFTPSIDGTEDLWKALQVRRPSIDDSLGVLVEMARGATLRADDQVVELETLRLLNRQVAATPPNPNRRRRLANLPLWVGREWRKDRPIYAVSDAILAEGLGSTLAVWMPGGELGQFSNLVEMLRLTSIGASGARVRQGPAVEADEDLRRTFADTIDLLKEDLARNAPATLSTLEESWQRLRDYQVMIDPDLTVAVDLEHGGQSVSVSAWADRTTGALYLRDPEDLTSVDAAGRAIAALFDTDARALSQAWLAAADQARRGREAADLKLADERASLEREDAEFQIARLQSLQAQAVARKGETSTKPFLPRSPTSLHGGVQRPVAPPETPKTRRVLVDPENLVVVDPNGTIVVGGSGKAPPTIPGRSRQGQLPTPTTGGATPTDRAGSRDYTELEKESLALRLTRRVLGSDDSRMVDLRAQRGVGADAIDELDQFFELKVSARDEPDQITLQRSQVERAISTPGYFLVIVSGVEGANATPRVRVIVDPLKHLRMRETSHLSYSGIHDATSLVFDLRTSAGTDNDDTAPDEA